MGIFFDVSAPEIQQEFARLTAPGYSRPGFDRVVQIRIDLGEIEWPVWRTFQIPATGTFWDLYVAINNAMEWEYAGINEFTVTLKIGERKLIDCDWTWRTPLDPYLSAAGQVAICRIANWFIAVEVEAVMPRVPRVRYPIMVAGAGLAPVEEAGPYFYAQFLEDYRRTPAAQIHGKREDGSPADARPFNVRNVAFDDPDDMWIAECCELTLMTDALESRAHLEETSDGRHPVRIPARFRDLALNLNLLPDHLLSVPVDKSSIPDYVTLLLTRADLVHLLGALLVAFHSCPDILLRRRLDRHTWYLRSISDALKAQSQRR